MVHKSLTLEQNRRMLMIYALEGWGWIFVQKKKHEHLQLLKAASDAENSFLLSFFFSPPSISPLSLRFPKGRSAEPSEPHLYLRCWTHRPGRPPLHTLVLPPGVSEERGRFWQRASDCQKHAEHRLFSSHVLPHGRRLLLAGSVISSSGAHQPIDQYTLTYISKCR